MSLHQRHCAECYDALPKHHGNRRYCEPCALVRMRRSSGGHITKAEAERFLFAGTEATSGSLYTEISKRLRKWSRVRVYRAGVSWLFAPPSDCDGLVKHNPSAQLVGTYDARATEAQVREDYEAVK